MKPSRNLLFRLIIGSTTLVVSIFAYWSYQVVRQLMLDSLKASAFAEVRNSANEIDQWLATRKSEISVLASTPTIQTLDWAVANPYLQRRVNDQADFFKFAMAYPDGTRYNTSGATRDKDSIKDRPFFKVAMTGRSFINDPIISRSTGVHQINISSPIRLQQSAIDQNHNPIQPIIGVFVGSVAVDRVTEVVNQLQYGENSYPFALNSEGQAITHPNPKLMSTQEEPGPSFLDLASPDLATVAQQMVSGEEGIELLEIDNNLQYVAFLGLNEANWSIALVIPRHNIERKLLLSRWPQIIVVFLGC